MTRTVRGQLDALEPRRLFSSVADVVPAPNVVPLADGGPLLIAGTAKGDKIELRSETIDRVDYIVGTVNGKTSYYLRSEVGSVTVSGRNGNDRIVDRGVFTGIAIYGDGGSDRIDSASRGATIYGGSSRDSLVNTGSGGSFLVGDSAGDTLYGGGGADTLFGGGGGDVIDGRGGGGDLYTNGGPGVAGGLGAMFDVRIAMSLDGVNNDGPIGENDDVRNCEVFVASPLADVLDFSRSPVGVTILDGFNGGADSITGSAFGDYLVSRTPTFADVNGATIRGGAGDDVIKASSGRDVIYGDGDDDQLVSIDTFGDLLDGGSGNDLLEDAGGPDTLVGGSGNDRIVNAGENATTRYRDEIRGSSGRDTLFGRRDDGDVLSGIETTEYA